MFDKKIAKVENKDGKLYMHEGFYPKMKTSMDALYDFPFNLVQNPKDKYAMLAYLSCDDAVAWMQEMTEIFLKGKQSSFFAQEKKKWTNQKTGVAKDIEEIVISPKNTKREVMLVGINGELNDDQSQFLHIVFKITLQNGGGVYSLDFSSAQFGYYSPVTPWSEYTDNRVSKVISSHCSGFAKHGWLSKIGQTTLEGYLAHIYRGCPDAMKNGMRNWESEYMPISTFLNLPQKQFEKAQRELCGMIELHIFSYRELMREQAKKALKNPSGLTKV